ncbi:MAG TPA: hypothetical protein VID48_07955 [Solirubrobacteraceae bacterium]|jgi:hypothetical protein
MQSATSTRSQPGSIWQARLCAGTPSRWAALALLALCLVALIGFFAFPTYPTYDSFYALLWGRDLLHAHLPDFRVYRGPTEHPLAIAFGMFCSIFGQAGARLMVLGSIGSFVALVAGLYRLGRLCFSPLVGVLAALLMLSRFFDENLAAQGYLDISYVALVVWAVVLEVQRPRRGWLTFLMLAAAGLLRPDAWVLSGAYWLWCAWPTLRRVGRRQTLAGGELQRLLGYAALALIAPVVWVATDAVVTGSPLYSLHSTAGLAAELERTQGLSSVIASSWTDTVRIDKLPVLLGAIAGLFAALWLVPRRMLLVGSVLALQLLVFVAEGAVGASVIDRYLMGFAALALLFCAFALGGWSLLQAGSKLRRAWMLGASALVLYGAYGAATTLSLSSLRNTLAYHEDFHKGLAQALHDRRVQAQLRRCPLLSLPNNKLIPDARWILDTVGQRDIVARSQARADAAKGAPALLGRIRRGSVAVYPLGAAVFFEAIVDVGDDPRDQVPLLGFKRVYTSHYYAVYANC